MNISFVIPNFNGEELLKKNLPIISRIAKRYKSGKSEIIVTDDSSRDDSVVFLKQFAKENKDTMLTILENNSGKNKGFSGNVNKGVKAANGDIVILLNTDVVPNDDFLTHLLKHFSNENLFAVGCMDESIENGDIVLRGRGKGEWIKGFLMHSAADVTEGNTTLWVSAGSGAFRKSIWETLGGLENLYNPFYWEDIDLSYRAQKAAFTVIFEPKSVVKHEHKKGSIQKNYSSFTVKKTAYRNQFFFTWLNATDTILIKEHIFYMPYFLLRAVLKGDLAFLLGFYNAFMSLPKVLHERRKVQKLVRKSDREIIAQFK